ncbi:MAG: hypothetical protein ACRDJX_00920 [Solirubrobacteraceae bacterium]
MKKIALLAALGTFALAGATAAGAGAAEPAFYECAKVAHGEFDGAFCEGTGHGKPRWDLREGLGKRKHSFFIKAGATRFDRPPYACTSSSLSGDLTSTTSFGHMRITLDGCTGSAGVAPACTSAGQRLGVVVLAPLSGVLGYIDREAHEVGVSVSSEDGGPVAAMKCGGASFQLNGSLVGVLFGADVNNVEKRFKLRFASVLEGFPQVEQLEGGPPDTLSVLDLANGEEERDEVEQLAFRGDIPRLEIKA